MSGSARDTYPAPGRPVGYVFEIFFYAIFGPPVGVFILTSYILFLDISFDYCDPANHGGGYSWLIPRYSYCGNPAIDELIFRFYIFGIFPASLSGYFTSKIYQMGYKGYILTPAFGGLFGGATGYLVCSIFSRNSIKDLTDIYSYAVPACVIGSIICWNILTVLRGRSGIDLE